MTKLMDVCGVILAGGQARRMGGKDKGLIMLNGQPLWRHVFNKLVPQVGHIVISANRNIERYAQGGTAVINDCMADYPGPLAGMLSVMQSTNSEWFLFCPCDTPQIPNNLAISFWQAREDASAIWVNDGERDHPTVVMMHRNIIPALKEYLVSGERRVMFFLRKIRAKTLTMSESKGYFANINTIIDLKRLQHRPEVPVLAISAWSGTGKTTLLKRIIPRLTNAGIRPGLIKHTHHDMDVDKPGKDSYELRKAGAHQTLLASGSRWAMMTETPWAEEPDLMWLASRMDASMLDIILVEGFKHEPIPKILLYRADIGHEPEALDIDEHVIALASDVKINTELPLLDLNQPESIVQFIIEWIQSKT